MRATILLMAILANYIAAPASAEEQFFDSNGCRIRYLIEGKGEPVILVHGFTANAEMNWALPGIIRGLAVDHRVIAMDCRGHGKSDKPHEPAKYGMEMVEDVVRLMDHLGIKKAHVVGYSMGSMITAKLLLTHHDRLITATLGGGTGVQNNPLTAGVFERLAVAMENGKGAGTLAAGLSPPGQPKPNGAQNEALERIFSATHDRQAMAACVRGWKNLAITDQQIAANRVPTLALIGTRDPLKFGVDSMKGKFANLKVVELEGAGHMTAPGHVGFLKSLREFIK